MDIDWWEYERRKKALPNDLTEDEYEIAVQKIVEELEKEVKENELY